MSNPETTAADVIRVMARDIDRLRAALMRAVFKLEMDARREGLAPPEEAQAGREILESTR